jgi:hypothetical protein
MFRPSHPPRLGHSNYNYTQPLTDIRSWKCFWGVESGRRVRLTTSRPRHLWADCLDNMGASTPGNPIGLYGLLPGHIYSTFCCKSRAFSALFLITGLQTWCVSSFVLYRVYPTGQYLSLLNLNRKTVPSAHSHPVIMSYSTKSALWQVRNASQNSYETWCSVTLESLPPQKFSCPSCSYCYY